MRANVASPFLLSLLIGCQASIGSEPLSDDPGATPNQPGAQPAIPNPICDQAVPIEVIEPSPPDLLMVVDKSGSMDERLDSGDEKWSVMRTALGSVAASYQDKIQLGMMLYPNGDECNPGTVVTNIGLQRASSITGQLEGVNPDGGTPTHTTLQGALAHYNAIPENPAGRYVLLATDGLPNCAPGNNQGSTVEESVAAVTQLASAGIATHVLGFGSVRNNNPDVLRRMAEAGGTGNFHPAGSLSELQQALETIAGELIVPACTFELSAAPEDLDQVEVLFDDQAIGLDPENGWDYEDTTNSITFFGASCSLLQSGEVAAVNIDFGCGDGGVVVL